MHTTHLLKNDVQFRAPREFRVPMVILGQKWAVLCRCRLSEPNLSPRPYFAKYHPEALFWQAYNIDLQQQDFSVPDTAGCLSSPVHLTATRQRLELTRDIVLSLSEPTRGKYSRAGGA